MNRKVLIGMLVIVAVLVLTGCGKKKEEEKKPETNVEEKTNVEETPVEDAAPPVPEEDYELYTDDKKMVFRDGDNYSLYFYNGTKVTGHQYYIDYGTSEKATEALENYEKPKNVNKITTNGRFLVLEYAKSEYSNLTIYKLRNQYGDYEILPDK